MNNVPDLTKSLAAQRLVDTAEILVGERGPHGISLREISRTAGQGNNYEVQYHFGDYAGLLRAIEARGIFAVEQARADMFAVAEAKGRLDDLRTLTELLYLPLIDLRAPDGERRFARFVLALLNASPMPLIDVNAIGKTSMSYRVLERICGILPELPMQLLMERERLIAIMVLTSVFNRSAPFDKLSDDRALIENALDMACYAVKSPVGAELSAILAG